MDATADEVLFGGAAGGGKSYGQVSYSLLYSQKYPGSRQLILRRTFPELEMSIIITALELIPKELYKSYNQSKHIMTFKNGSIIQFGFCQQDNDVLIYQSAEFDVIRLDEATHFSEYIYKYLMSRLRGANKFPKQMKCSTNPGGPGHTFFKERFIDPVPPNTLNETPTGSRIFIPSKVQDNIFLIENDPGYLVRLENLDGDTKKALLDGSWDLFEGCFFNEFNRDIHVVDPFPIPSDWRIYFVMDYGLDMLAGYWIAVDYQDRAYVFREVYKPDLDIGTAAKLIRSMTSEDVYMYLAPEDLWGRRQETGRSAAEIFLQEGGIMLHKTGRSREPGWLAVKEYLRPFKDEFGITTAKLTIFSNCVNLIRCLPALRHDEKKYNDVATTPHEITHAPDAIRYFCTYRTGSPKVPLEPDPMESYLNQEAEVFTNNEMFDVYDTGGNEWF